MRFLSLRCFHFRNIADSSFVPHERCNVFFGENGQGKTNLLEAFYLLSTLRSFRTHRNEECIELGFSQSRVSAQIEHQGVSHQLEVTLDVDKTMSKVGKVDGKVQKSVDYLGRVHAILFVPEDLRLLRGAPMLRRKFLDRAIFNGCASYLKEAQIYERVLKQRNALLRSRDAEMLSVYDQQLAEAGAVLYRRRTMYLQELLPRFSASFERISQTGAVATFLYHSRYVTEPNANICDQLLSRLTRDHKRDIETGYTHSGPHSDDFEFFLGGKPAATFASQGQTRALILALKIAEIQHFYETQSFAPVLLLDDVGSELDAQRTEQLFLFLQEIPSQIFITTTDQNQIPFKIERENIPIVSGRIEAKAIEDLSRFVDEGDTKSAKV